MTSDDLPPAPSDAATPQPWTGLSLDDQRQMLISLVGFEFGQQPEQQVDLIRASRRRYAARFVRQAGINSHHNVLEIGSGCGFGTGLLAQRAASVIACDISPAYLDYARQECQQYQTIQFRHIENRSLHGINDHSIDAVVSISVFIHLNLYDIYWYLLECHRVLKPGGRVCFDFSDEHMLFRTNLLRRQRQAMQDQVFLEHCQDYRSDHHQLFALLQWNSEEGICQVAKRCGFRRVNRYSARLLLSKR
ncbi:MAG: class I SAM-dependent methyltransferase [Gammaproteobacteria bacterium]|nr:class I SAM-dependent methyltransferase [Gammaproteobacteria bacterium]